MRRAALAAGLILALAAPAAALADDAALLGPQTNGSSTGAANSLQPNGNSSLQNGAASSSLGGSQSDAQAALQRPATSEEAKLFIQGDASSSGSPQDIDQPWYLNLVGLFAAVIGFGVGIWWWRRRRAVAVSSTQPLPVEPAPKVEVDQPAPAAKAAAKRTTKASPKRKRKSRRR